MYPFFDKVDVTRFTTPTSDSGQTDHQKDTLGGKMFTDGGGSLIKCKLPASGTSDIYIGEMGIKATATISVSAPASAAAVTLILG
jgi:hypothetical protein